MPSALSSTEVFIPPYDRVEENDYATSWGTTAQSKARANKETGYLGLYTNVWAGAGFAEAKQFVSFYVPEDCTVRVKARIKYVGGKAEAFSATWSGIKAVWEIDGKEHERNIESAFTVLSVLDEIFAVVSLSTPGLSSIQKWQKLAEVIDILYAMYLLISPLPFILLHLFLILKNLNNQDNMCQKKFLYLFLTRLNKVLAFGLNSF